MQCRTFRQPSDGFLIRSTARIFCPQSNVHMFGNPIKLLPSSIPLKGYPISSFLFWEIKPERRADWEIYKFIENFRFGDTHNEISEPDGRDVILVLDGQQRLTSLLIGLRGSFTVRSKYRRRNNPEAWSRQRLYIDLLKDPANDEDDEDREDFGSTYGLRFAEHEPESDAAHLWMKVGRILDCTSDDAFDILKDEMLENLPTALQGLKKGSL